MKYIEFELLDTRSFWDLAMLHELGQLDEQFWDFFISHQTVKTSRMIIQLNELNAYLGHPVVANKEALMDLKSLSAIASLLCTMFMEQWIKSCKDAKREHSQEALAKIPFFHEKCRLSGYRALILYDSPDRYHQFQSKVEKTAYAAVMSGVGVASAFQPSFWGSFLFVGGLLTCYWPTLTTIFSDGITESRVQKFLDKVQPEKTTWGQVMSNSSVAAIRLKYAWFEQAYLREDFLINLETVPPIVVKHGEVLKLLRA